jgi:hypothetical protein
LLSDAVNNQLAIQHQRTVAVGIGTEKGAGMDLSELKREVETVEERLTKVSEYL